MSKKCEEMKIQTVGVIGAGVIGRGIAHNLGQTNHRVILVDVSKDILEKAQAEIRKNLRFYKLFNKEFKEKDDVVLERIECVTDFSCLRDVDFIIENVTEDFAIKKQVYETIDEICRDEVIFAANTSAISITHIGSHTKRPERVLGIHFMNPVPLKPCVEVIRGYHTSDETIDRANALLASMGKEAILVKDSPGFVSNRVLMLSINEAVYLVYEGVAAPDEIDRIFKSCFGHKMGMLETADLIGLDTILRSIGILYESFNDSKYRPCPLLKKMVDAGLLGRKSGQGFYKYQTNQPPL